MSEDASRANPLIASHPEKLRRTERVFIRIPVEVKGNDCDGKPFSEKTATVVVNGHGARINLKAVLRPQDEVTVTNAQNSMTCPFRVVERATKPLGTGAEWGIECLEPDKNFWGIMFPEKIIKRSPTPEVSESADALIECSVCHTREFAHLTLEQYRKLASSSRLERPCPRCGTTAVWRFGLVEAEAETLPQVSPGEPRVKSAAEKRRDKRVAIKLPVKIRLQNGREEISRTEDINISRTGVCFSSKLDLHVGQRIYLAVGHSKAGRASEVEARVAWRRQWESAQSALYGVHLERPA